MSVQFIPLEDILKNSLRKQGLSEEQIERYFLPIISGMPEMFVVGSGKFEGAFFGGASAIIKPEKLAERFENDYLVIIPSSIHELIVVAMDEEPSANDIERFSSMIKDVNSNECLPKDVLAAHPYIYEKASQRIRIA